MFYLIIPFAILIISSIVYLVISLFSKHLNTKKAVLLVSILPVFILSQLSSGFIVDKIQGFRCEKIISEVQLIRKNTGEFPIQYHSNMGIEYVRLENKDGYSISYSRGFLVTEKYYSESKTWRSYGWND